MNLSKGLLLGSCGDSYQGTGGFRGTWGVSKLARMLTSNHAGEICYQSGITDQFCLLKNQNATCLEKISLFHLSACRVGASSIDL